MTIKLIKITECCESKTNTRGKDAFQGPAFNDLVASIKEKGVIVPVIVRETSSSNRSVAYEVVAGSRRLQAAAIADLQQIPADVRELSDVEAREIQIIENLQREDIHPVAEGEEYRKLIEVSGYEVKDVAAKVGKSESYVRQRLLLTNLTKAASKEYRAGKIDYGRAVLVAGLSPNDQETVIKEIKSGWNAPTAVALKELIEREIYKPLASQPWLHDKKVAEAVGPCKECPPNRSDLFGEIKDGQCTDLVCWKRKMDLYVDYRKGGIKDLILVRKDYGSASKGVLSRSNYESLGSKKKQHCSYARQAIAVEGPGAGSIFWICADGSCKKHHYSFTSYEQTPAEKKRRKKQLQRVQAEKDKEDKRILIALKKVRWPMSKKVLDAILEKQLGRGPQILRPVMNRHKLKIKLVTRKNWEGKMVKERDVGATLRDAAKNMKPRERLQLVIEIILEDSWEEAREKIIKML
ncbi:MAG: ParB/RepB/Spo0J family partition protein [Patescibacteria group bacterium]|nr:ParB/RepB/Spo0J family partition protein [Patescibacteria group bacterium]